MLPWKKKKKKCKPKTKSYNKVPAWIQKGISSTWILLSQSNSNFFNFKPDPANCFGRSPRANLILQHILCGLNGACTLLASLLPTSPLPDILRTPSQRVSSHQTHFTSHHVELTLPRVSISVCFILSPNISKSHSLFHVIIMHLSSLPQGAALSGGIKAWQLSALPSMPNLFGLMDNGCITAEHFLPRSNLFSSSIHKLLHNCSVFSFPRLSQQWKICFFQQYFGGVVFPKWGGASSRAGQEGWGKQLLQAPWPEACFYRDFTC